MPSGVTAPADGRSRDAVETHAWVQAIVARHIEDRLSTTDGGRPFQSDHDHHTQRELISLLGPGNITIRRDTATFTHVVGFVS